ncbi:hypothetical protein [Microvirga lotononidis]|uniref:Uncharacterized protein n=1 Tax=Microvirga lotononidis TaxID=864069 RepID=I4Z4Q5_9HYPH|nr:hypothetical protein [Microvirga lotononidis]EIM31197.1 hypothetical protein MicloDRAFT_00001870 [Microvirga lotononidis]WQO30564.1 hypothetical protein U0023_24265 [Microvirga lotononidis]WQO30923.1 hypothetical protein U0023_26305 [Microvirga lotononidis]
MFANTLKHLTSEQSQRPTETYSPDILPLMQSLLGSLADIDFEFQNDRETILQSTIEEPLKHRAIATLKERHHERRAPYVRELDELERQIQMTFT